MHYTIQAMQLVLYLSMPTIIITTLVGLLVGLFQALTSIQEQTLTFVPKILSVFIILMVVGHWILNSITQYIVNLWSDFSIYVQ